MKKERILSFKMSSLLTEEDLNNVAGGQLTYYGCGHASGGTGGAWDVDLDVTIDL